LFLGEGMRRTILYFAYGANMNLKHLEKLCPNCDFLHRVFLRDFSFVYDGARKKRVYANIIPQERGKVWGGLFKINLNGCIRKLDEYEDYPEDYRRSYFRVTSDKGKIFHALTYFREAKTPGSPAKSYHTLVLKGAESCKLPEDYTRKFL